MYSNIIINPLLATADELLSLYNQFVGLALKGLTKFIPVSYFYTPWKQQKIKGYFAFAGGIGMKSCHEIG